jgi:hypothetical protein
MHYIKEFLSLCTYQENGIDLEFQDMIDSYRFWSNRCYLGTLLEIPSLTKWKRFINLEGTKVKNIFLKYESDWEYLTDLKEPGFVYLIQNEHNHLIKIGVSKNPYRRIRQLQTGNDSILRLLGIIKVEDAFSVERLLHTRYAKDRVSGEWFSVSESEIRILSSYFVESQ